MQEQFADRAGAAVTQAARAYTPEERAKIAILAQGTTHRAEIEALFPNRTVAAIKQQIVAERHRLGLVATRECGHRGDGGGTMLEPDDPGEDDDWWPRYCRDQRRGSAALLEALRTA